MRLNTEKSKSILLRLVALLVRVSPQVILRFSYRILSKFSWTRNLIQGVFSSSIPDTISIDGATIALNKDDPVVSGTLAAGAFEKYELALFRKSIKSGMTVLDIGANVGCFSAIASLAVGSNGRVYAFEPDPKNFSYLQKTAEFSPYRNIFCHQVAISDKEGFTELFLSKINPGDHRLFPSGDDREAVRVRSVALDSFAQNEGIGNVDVIKMDIQGFEGYAFNGMKKILSENRDIQIFTEFCPYFQRKSGFGEKNLLAILRDHNFNVFVIDADSKSLKLVDLNDTEPLIKSCRFEGYLNLYCRRG